MDGKIIGGDYVNAVRIDDDEITVACKNNIINRTIYDNLTIFDDQNVIGLPDQKKEVDQFTVIDTMMAVSFVFKDTAFTLKTGDDLVNEIHINKDYINSPAKISVISNLTKKQLCNFDFSDTMAKFKTEIILKESGFTGNFMKRDEIVLEVQERIVKPKMNIYEEAEKIKFIYV